MNEIYRAAQQRLDSTVKLAGETRAILIGEGTIAQTIDLFRQCFGDRTAVIVADHNTYNVIGKTLESQLRQKNTSDFHLAETFLFPNETFHADREHADMLVLYLAKSDAIPIAVGSGTINDLTKLASYECKRSYMVVTTAASMDGYTAFGASVEVKQSKQTKYCPAPAAVLVDMNIVAAAPREMGSWGYADLIAKLPAGADWILADTIGTEVIDPVAWPLVQEHLHDWLANPEGIAQRDKVSLAHLMEGLLMSGLGMQKIKSSRTASGAEHQFSHLWDNQNHTHNGQAPSHGAKVGIGTISISALYERVIALSKEDLLASKQTIANWKWEWPKVESKIREHFGKGDLAQQMLGQYRQKYVELDETLRRIDVLVDHWDELCEKFKRQNIPAVVVQNMIRQCGAPSTPEEIGISRERLFRSFEQAQLIRYRYNILDFARETGLWDRLVEPIFAPGGIWG